FVVALAFSPRLTPYPLSLWIAEFFRGSLKVDHIFSPRLSGFFKYTHDSIPTEEPGGIATGSSLPGVATTRTNAPGSNIAARLAMVITPHFINELGYSYSHGAVLSQPFGLLSPALSRDIS